MAPAVNTKFVTFDMNGTLIDFRIDDAIRQAMTSRIPSDREHEFLRLTKQLRVDECMGEWKPFREVIERSLRRSTALLGLEYRDGDAETVWARIPSFEPYQGVTEALRRLAETLPLVIITNTDNAQVQSLVDHLRAPIEVVITSEQMGVYKPRLRAFEYLLDRLGVHRHDIVHVSASPQYDLRPAHDIGITRKVFVDRGFEPQQPWLEYEHITDIADLPRAVGAVAQQP